MVYSDLLFLNEMSKKINVSSSDCSGTMVALPPPRLAGAIPIEECLRARRSRRIFSEAPLTLEDAAQLLWAAQGVTGLAGLRTAPSAGAIYPLHTYLISLNISQLNEGSYAYDPYTHSLTLRKAGDHRNRLLKAACEQNEVEGAALGILFSINFNRSKREFGDIGVRLAHIETGHAAQNVLLQATALSINAIGMGRLDPLAMRKVADVPASEESVYLILAGSK